MVDRRPSTIDNRRPVVVIGGANVDIIATTDGPRQPSGSTPGRVRIGAGGAARNVAENLARLGVPTMLIAAVGDHPMADWPVTQAAQAGVDITGMVRVRERGNYYVAIRTANRIERAISDMAAAESLTPDQIDERAAEIRAADVVVVDANLLPATIQRAVELAGAPICLLAVSMAKAPRMRAVLSRASLIVLAAAEAGVLTGRNIRSESEAMRAGETLRLLGGATVVITMAERGLGWVDAESIWLPAPQGTVVDSLGAGDAVAAVAVYSLLAKLDTRAAATMALAAATMTVAVEGATHPGLSLEALHAYR